MPDRAVRWKRQPDSVLRTPWEVATWIDERTRAHGHRREVWVAREREWVAIGDEDDLAHLRQENFAIASRGDSIHTDIYAESKHHDLYVEAVTDDQCLHRCSA